ncbi:MAG: PEGA domain-containing protein, partial [Polyangiaceae bacterium]|nr:PEGA domain-containing protein [Polyangiaceae bacterium]
APGSAAVTVDSRPTEREGERYVGGTLPPGPAEPVAFSAVSEGHARFTVTLDPGAHVLTFTAPGHTESVFRENFRPASHKELSIALLELNGTLRVSSSPIAAVYVDGTSIGPSPISVDRVKGSYRVSVRKDGYAPFETTAILRPGERTELNAALRLAPTPITKKWWFYAIIAGVAAAGAVTTYAIVRANDTPAPNGGTIGWVVTPP